MASHDPSNYQFSTTHYVAMFATLLTAYYMYVLCACKSNPPDHFFSSWDTSMSQKSRFKMQTQGVFNYRKTFPQLPGGTIKNPTFIQTAHG